LSSNRNECKSLILGYTVLGRRRKGNLVGEISAAPAPTADPHHAQSANIVPRSALTVRAVTEVGCLNPKP
jgi:hypothetical protein